MERKARSRKGRSTKWSEQMLVKETVRTTVNGEEVVKTMNVLQIITSGMDLYREEFVQGKYKDKNMLVGAFDWVATASSMCPKGHFYELQYSVGPGRVKRGLMQLVDPVNDVRTVLAAAIRTEYLPKDISPIALIPRKDIDVVWMGGCFRDEEDGEATISYGIIMTEDAEQSITEHTTLEPSQCACMDFRSKKVVSELWTKPADIAAFPPVFVHGEVNANEPAFANMRKWDIQAMLLHLNLAVELARKHGLQYMLMAETLEEVGDALSHGVFMAKQCDDGWMQMLTKWSQEEK